MSSFSNFSQIIDIIRLSNHRCCPLFRDGLCGVSLDPRHGVLLPQRGSRGAPHPQPGLSTLQQATTPPHHRRQTPPRRRHRERRQRDRQRLGVIVRGSRLHGHLHLLQGVLGRGAAQGLHPQSARAPGQVHPEVTGQDVPQPRSAGQPELEGISAGGPR